MRSLLVLYIALTVPGVLNGAQELTKKAKIERILLLTKADSMMDQMFSQMKTMLAPQIVPGTSEDQRAQAQEVHKRIMDAMKARMNWDKMRPEYVKLYDETYGETEIDGILAFYESSAGRAMLEKMPLLMSKSMALGQAQMNDFLPEIKKIAEEVAKGVK